MEDGLKKWLIIYCTVSITLCFIIGFIYGDKSAKEHKPVDNGEPTVWELLDRAR